MSDSTRSVASRPWRPDPLALLHPAGVPSATACLGSGPARALEPGAAGPGGEADLILLAPSEGERRDRGWRDEAVARAGAVATDGLVVVAGAGRELAGPLEGAGLVEELRLAHLPDLATSLYTFPLRGPAADYALSEAVPLSPSKRLAGRALAGVGIVNRGRSSHVFRRPGAAPLLGWLAALDSSTRPCTALIRRSWKPDGATVIHRFSDEPAPDLVVKIGHESRLEAAALRNVAPGAATASVGVPAIIDETSLGDVPLLVESAVRGRLAPTELRGSPAAAASLMRAVAEWLSEWGAATVSRRSFGSGDAERHLLSKARALAGGWAGGERYLADVGALCEVCIGTELPFVAAHGDLTAANLLLGAGGSMSIVDWERASADGLPLTDLAYAMADFAAAAAGYEDRPAGYAACFEPGGSFLALARELLGTEARRLELEAPQAELCLHACWLLHADNERLNPEPGSAERPFLEILRRFAEGPR